MGFKEPKASFDTRTKFRDEMTRFVSHEAAMFTPSEEGSEEVASAKVDASFEKVVNLSAQKNKTKVNEAKREEKSLKQIEVEQKSEIKAFQKEVKREKKESPNLDQRFESKDTIRLSESKEKLKQTKSQKKEVKKREKKELKKQGSKLALGQMLKGKKEISNELGGGGTVSGDAFSDGKGGLVGTVLEAINPMHYFKAWLAKIAAMVAPAAMLILTFGIILVIFITLIFDVLSPMAEIGNAITNFISIFTDEHTFSNASMTEEEIDAIVAETTCDEAQEKVIRFALSKVGYPYSQDLRDSGTYYDCSSLAYYSWKDAGADISYGSGYPPSAAEGARVLFNDGKSVGGADIASFSLEPGDLIYYGGSDNGRYKGIYHVAIYIGNGCAVEALNTAYGVVYQTLRTENAIMICRPA